MTYRIPLPDGGRRSTLDIVDAHTTIVQRLIRQRGLGAYEPPTAAALLTLGDLAGPGFVMFDVGANMGLYGAVLASMFSPRRVHAFEPAPVAADVAARIARRNRLAMTVHRVAASDRTGVADLHLSPVSDASNSLVAGFRDTDVCISVPTITIDEAVARHGDHPDIVKIDVETHEPAVLRGARGTIERHRPAIVIEVLAGRGRDQADEVNAVLAGLGYRCYPLVSAPTWRASTAVHAAGTAERDWLLVPDELDDRFAERWERWRLRWTACSLERNPRVPIGASVRAAYRRGGLREVVATAQRYRRSCAESR